MDLRESLSLVNGNWFPLRTQLGECPIWHPTEELLYCVDIMSGSIFKYNPVLKQVESHKLTPPIGCIGFRKTGGLIFAGTRGFHAWSVKGMPPRDVGYPESHRQGARFNDGKVDAKGRFWAGMMTDGGFGNGLYCLEPTGAIRKMADGIGISNGIGWSPDNRIMYFTDSARHIIYAYDFDLPSGQIANRRIFVTTEPGHGTPDGLTVDIEGFVWSAFWDGWKIARYAPNGNRELEIRLPVQRPTSCTFGGQGLNCLFITSASTGISSSDLKFQPLAGDLLWIETDTCGQPENFFQG